MVFSERQQKQNMDEKIMKITNDIEPFPGIQPHFGGVMSDGDKLLDFTPDNAEACFGVICHP